MDSVIRVPYIEGGTYIPDYLSTPFLGSNSYEGKMFV